MAAVRRMNYFRVTIGDRPGELLEIMQELKGKAIGLSMLWAFGTDQGKGLVYLVAKSTEKLRAVLREKGLPTEEGTGFYLSGADRTGAFLKTLEALANGDVNIKAIDGIAVGGKFGSFLRVAREEVEKAAAALGAK